MSSASDDLLARLDDAPLTPRYWAAFTLIVLQLVCEIFDFFVVGSLVSALAPRWGLTFGQTTIMLLSAGVGAIVGALGLGRAADRVGRKTVMVGSGVICCLAAGSIAFIPEGAWVGFALLRFLVGFGYGGAGASQFALIVEYTPLRRRTLLASWVAVPAGLGVLLASAAFSSLFPALGWRGVAALGFVPLIFAVLPNRIGRVPCGKITGYVGAAALAAAALLHDARIEGASLFFVCLLIGQFFYDGAFSNVNTYATELYPVRLAGLGTGLSAASGGAGKIIGPLVLGLLAGTHNLVTPQATQQAVLPGFLFLAACCLVVGLSYSLLGVETHRQPLALA